MKTIKIEELRQVTESELLIHGGDFYNMLYLTWNKPKEPTYRIQNLINIGIYWTINNKITGEVSMWRIRSPVGSHLLNMRL